MKKLLVLVFVLFVAQEASAQLGSRFIARRRVLRASVDRQQVQDRAVRAANRAAFVAPPVAVVGNNQAIVTPVVAAFRAPVFFRTRVLGIPTVIPARRLVVPPVIQTGPSIQINNGPVIAPPGTQGLNTNGFYQ